MQGILVDERTSINFIFDLDMNNAVDVMFEGLKELHIKNSRIKNFQSKISSNAKKLLRRSIRETPTKIEPFKNSKNLVWLVFQRNAIEIVESNAFQSRIVS